MRSALALVVIAGCGDNIASPLPAPQIALDVLASQDAVKIYTDGNDLLPCACVVDTFPQPDTCQFITDARGCAGATCESCFTDVGIEADGVRIPTTFNGDTHTFDAPPGAVLTLVMSGCSAEPVRLVIGGQPTPAPTITSASVSPEGPTVSWTTDIPATSTQLTIYVGSHGATCHVSDANQYTFTDWPDATPNVEIIQTFGAHTVRNTPLGPATIWWGDAAYTTFPQQQ